MSDPLTMTPAQIADALQISEDEFLRKRPYLQRAHEFPRALPGNMLRWSRAQIVQWINSEYEEYEAAPAQPASPANDLIARLQVRYGGGAA